MIDKILYYYIVLLNKVLFTFSFALYGKTKEVDDARKILGRACFNSGFNVQDFFLTNENYTYGFVKIDKESILYKSKPKNPDFIFIFDTRIKEVLKDVENSIVIFNTSDKVKLNNKKLKIFSVDTSDIDTSSAMIGALVKNFNKLSIKNTKLAIEKEKIGNTNSLDEGYKRVK